MQEPDASLKHPPVSWIPFAKVDVAVVEVTLRAVVWMPPAKVEVAVPRIFRIPVVVALPAIVRPPAAAPLPIVDEAYAVRPPLKFRRVVVALFGKRYAKFE